VRIYTKKGDFRKGYTPNYTKEIFVIEKVFNTKPITYKIHAEDGEEIIGSFYEKELSKVVF
jgi:hypothetical protein